MILAKEDSRTDTPAILNSPADCCCGHCATAVARCGSGETCRISSGTRSSSYPQALACSNSANICSRSSLSEPPDH